MIYQKILDYHQYLEEYKGKNKDKFKIFKTRCSVRADLVFSDMATQKTMRNAFKNKRTSFFAFLEFILKQTPLKHSVIVEASLVASSYAEESLEYHVDFLDVENEMVSIIISLKMKHVGLISEKIKKKKHYFI